VPAGMSCEKQPLVDLIRTAYGVDADSVIGGSSLARVDRFRCDRQSSPHDVTGDVKLMLQALLADRFKLVVHTDTRPIAAFVLSAGKGRPKLRNRKDRVAPDARLSRRSPRPVRRPLLCGLVPPHDDGGICATAAANGRRLCNESCGQLDGTGGVLISISNGRRRVCSLGRCQWNQHC